MKYTWMIQAGDSGISFRASFGNSELVFDYLHEDDYTGDLSEESYLEEDYRD